MRQIEQLQRLPEADGQHSLGGLHSFPQLVPPLPPAAGKRRSPAPPGFGLSDSFNIGSSPNSAPSTWAAPGAKRCSTAGRNSGKYYFGARCATAGGVSSDYLPSGRCNTADPSHGNSPDHQSSWLEEENLMLRAELSRSHSETWGPHHRPMAAIAGGGFRGSSGPSKQCMCDALRAKLARLRAELREARSETRGRHCSAGPLLPELMHEEVEVQTSPTLPQIPLAPEPAPEPGIVFSDGRDAHTQTRTFSTSDVSVQVIRRTPLRDASVQAANVVSAPEVAQLETQAGINDRSGVTQTLHLSRTPSKDTAAQTFVHTEECAVQLDLVKEREPSMDVGVQTARTATESVSLQVGGLPFFAACAETQTELPDCVGVEIQVDLLPRKPAVRAFGTQTAGYRSSAASVQTTSVRSGCVATQTISKPSLDQGAQTTGEYFKQTADVSKLKAQIDQLTEYNADLIKELQEIQEKAQAWQNVAQNHAFGQMNVTILSPRAECTVQGEHIEMDAWNPRRLREEFEREVLPRFTRVFVEEGHSETAHPGAGGHRTRSRAVEQAMAEFAEIFRERLQSMLGAPSAAEAVQAASSKVANHVQASHARVRSSR